MVKMLLDLLLIYVGLIVLVAGLLPRVLDQRAITAPIVYLVVHGLLAKPALDWANVKE